MAGKAFCELHPDVQMILDCTHNEPYCSVCLDEETEEEPKEKPLLNAARIHQFGTYRLFFDVRVVDEAQGIWEGRPVPEANLSKLPGAQEMEKSWVLFTRVYDDKNEWDKVYPEYEIKDAEMFGQKLLIVPKEKILFSYNPPPGSGIVIPMPGIFKGG